MDPATAKSCLTALCFAFGHEVNRQRMNALYTILRASEWTVAELELATAFIPSDSELCKTISFERTIAPGVFAEAKKRPEVMRGRLHDYRAAVEMSQEMNRPLTQCFEAVVVDGEDTPRWMML